MAAPGIVREGRALLGHGPVPGTSFFSSAIFFLLIFFRVGWVLPVLGVRVLAARMGESMPMDLSRSVFAWEALGVC